MPKYHKGPTHQKNSWGSGGVQRYGIKKKSQVTRYGKQKVMLGVTESTFGKGSRLRLYGQDGQRPHWFPSGQRLRQQLRRWKLIAGSYTVAGNGYFEGAYLHPSGRMVIVCGHTHLRERYERFSGRPVRWQRVRYVAPTR